MQEKCENVSIEFRATVNKSMRNIRETMEEIKKSKSDTDELLDQIQESIFKTNQTCETKHRVDGIAARLDKFSSIEHID